MSWAGFLNHQQDVNWLSPVWKFQQYVGIPRFWTFFSHIYFLVIHLARENTQMYTNYPVSGHEPSLLKAHFQPGINRKICIFFGCLYGCNPCPLACYIPTLPGWQGQRVLFSFLKWEACMFFFQIEEPQDSYYGVFIKNVFMPST